MLATDKPQQNSFPHRLYLLESSMRNHASGQAEGVHDQSDTHRSGDDLEVAEAARTN